MKDSNADDTVIETLQAALNADRLPTAARDYAEHLLRRLASPVRVSVLGLPGSGKSELINMFVGRRLLPKDATLPTTEVVYGEEPKMTVTQADGTVLVEDKVDLDTVSGTNAAFLKVETTAPILRRVSLLEVVTDGTVAELSSAIDWSVRRTDIALWCTQVFDMEEQAIWGRVPDSLKDHAFLVLTRADELSADRSLSKRVASLETVVAEEFHSLFAVATLQAIGAHDDDGAVDEQTYHASGGGALTAEILRHAERGRRADFDGAHMFLARYKIRSDDAQTGDEAPAKVQDVAPKSTERQVTEEAPTAAPPAPDAEPPSVTDEPARVENVALISDAIRFLKRRGDSLGELAKTLSEGETKSVVDQCVDAVENLTDLFSQDESGCPVADAMIDELTEAEDLMVLMQIEDGDAPAADAATLLLQLRRDMEMKLAA